MKRNRPTPRVARPARAAPADILAQDPLLARLAVAESEAKQHLAGTRLKPATARPSERQRKDALVTLANLDFAIAALRGARDEMRSALDGRLTAHRALDAYHRAGTLSDIPVRR
jgi:hypothetical protein